jgi:hypothetical protein
VQYYSQNWFLQSLASTYSSTKLPQSNNLGSKTRLTLFAEGRFRRKSRPNNIVPEIQGCCSYPNAACSNTSISTTPRSIGCFSAARSIFLNTLRLSKCSLEAKASIRFSAVGNQPAASIA